MKKTTAKITLYATVLILILSMLTMVVFAYFSADFAVDNDFSSSNIKIASSITDNSVDGGFVFGHSGTTYNAKIKVENQSVGEKSNKEKNNIPISYEISVKGVSNLQVADALLLKIDGNYMGILSKYATADNGDGFLIPISQPLPAGATRTHTLELELHIGAGSIFAQEKQFLTISVTGSTFYDSSYIFVNDAYEFLQTIQHINTSKYINKTVVLLNDIALSTYNSNRLLDSIIVANNAAEIPVLTSDLVINKNINIDLNGKRLNLNTGLIFKHNEDGISKILDSFGGGSVNFADKNEKGIVVDAPNSLVEIQNTLKYEQSAVYRFSAQKLFDNLYEDILFSSQNGVGKESGTVEILNNTSMYYNFISLANYDKLLCFYDENGVSITDSNGILLPLEGSAPKQIFIEATQSFTKELISKIDLKVNSLSTEPSINGSLDIRVLSEKSQIDSILNAVISECNAYLLDTQIENGVELPIVIARNLYLPTAVRAYNATITWVSSDISLLSNNGEYLPGLKTSEIKLSAIISYQGERYIKEFTLEITPLSLEERLQEICLISPLLYTELGEQEIFQFKEGDFSKYNLTITNIEMSEDMQSLFNLNILEPKDKSTLTLESTPVGEFKSVLKITASDNENPDLEVTCDLDITVKIKSSTSIIEEANREVKNIFDNLGGNTFGSFDLPMQYAKIVDIRYEIIPDSNPSLPSDGFVDYVGVRHNNPYDVLDYVNIVGVDAYGNSVTLLYDVNGNITNIGDIVGFRVAIDTGYVPPFNQIVNIKVSYTYKDTTDSSKDEISVRCQPFEIAGIIQQDRDVEDFALYIKLVGKYDLNNDYIITYDEAHSGQSSDINLSYNGIINLKGLEYFPITDLNLSYNNISDLSPLKNMTDLQILNVSNNKIYEVSQIANMINLVSLNISNNSINDIDALDKLVNLTSLDISNNTLNSLQILVNMKNLGSLLAKGTDVSSFISGNNVSNLNPLVTAYNNYRANNSKTPTYRINRNNDNIFSPTSSQTVYNNFINTINPIYEFYNVIHLPTVVNQKLEGRDCVIEWSSSNTDIVKIEGNKAYILQPHSDVTVKLTATLKSDATTLISKQFTVISRGEDDKYISIYNKNIGGLVDARVAIPDEELRYWLFKYFDLNLDGSISQSEIENINTNKEVLLLASNIKNLKGLELFYKIEQLNLSNNPFESLTYFDSNNNERFIFENYENLNVLRLNNSQADLTKISLFDENLKFTIFSVVGSTGINDEAVVNALYEVYKRNLLGNGSIYVFDNTNAWNPYSTELNKAINLLLETVVVNAGDTIPQAQLPLTLKYNLYGEEQVLTVGYNTSYNNNFVSYANNTASTVKSIGKDVYDSIAVTLTYEGISVTRHKSIYILALNELLIEIPLFDALGNAIYENSVLKTELKLFSEFVDDYEARVSILNAVGNISNNTITRDLLANVKSISFSSENADADNDTLRVIKAFYGLNLDSVTINRLVGIYNDRAINPINNLNFIAQSLTTLSINNSFVDVSDLNLPNLKTLKFSRCPVIIFSDSASNIFTTLESLTTFEAYNNYIYDFSSLENLVLINSKHNLSTILIYNNPSANIKKTDTVLNKVYANLSDEGRKILDYKVVSTVKWGPNKDVGDSLKNVNPYYLSNSGKVLLTPNLEYVNYLHSSVFPLGANSLELYLPTEIYSQISENTHSIVWGTAYNIANVNFNTTLTFGETVVVDGIDYIKATVNRQAADAFVRLTAYMPEFDKTFEYFFFVAGISTNAGNLDLEQFMTSSDGEFYDIYFFKYIFDTLIDKYPNRENKTGVIKIQNFTSISYNGESTLKPKIRNIKGIEQFSNVVTSIDLSFNNIVDISPLQGFSKLSTLTLRYNNIDTLYLPSNANGSRDSIFKNLTSLQNFDIQHNYNIEDYSALVYENDISKNIISYSVFNTLKIDGFFDRNDANTISPSFVNQSNILDTIEIWAYIGNITAKSISLDTYTSISNSSSIKVIDFVNMWKYLKTCGNEVVNTNGVYTISLPGANKPGYNLICKPYNTTSSDWYTFTEADGTLSITNTDAVSALGDIVELKLGYEISGIFSARTLWVHKTVLFDTKHLNGKTDEQDRIPKIEISPEQKIVYTSLYSLEDGDFEVSGTNFLLNADILIPDYEISRLMFFTYDLDKNKILTINEREDKDNKVKVTSFSFDTQNVKQINGIELFPKIKEWKFVRNQITTIPKLPFDGGRADITLLLTDNFLVDISGLAAEENIAGQQFNSLGYAVKSLTLQTDARLSQEQSQYIVGMPNLTSLILQNNGFYDYQFLVDLSKTQNNKLEVLRILASDRYNSINSYDNINKITQTLFNTTNKGNGLSLSYGTDNAQSFAGLDINTKLINDYLINAKKVEIKDDGYFLDSAFSAFGQEYGIIWSIPNGVNYYQLAGNKITFNSDFSASTFDINCQVVYNGKATFKQTLTLSCSAVGGDEGQTYISTDCEIQLQQGGSFVYLSSLIGDMGLRVAIINAYQLNAQNQITYEVLSSPQYRNLKLVAHSESSNYGTVSNYPINSLDGIEILNPFVRDLTISYINTKDISPLAKLTYLNSLTIDRVDYSIDKTKYTIIEDLSFLVNLKNLTRLVISISNLDGIDMVIDSDSLINIYNSGDYKLVLSLINALSYIQSEGNLQTVSPYPAGAIEKYASVLLNNIDFRDTNGNDLRYEYQTVVDNVITQVKYSNMLLKPQKAGEKSLTLSNKIYYQDKIFQVEYIPLTANISITNDIALANAVFDISDMKNYTRAKFIARLKLDVGSGNFMTFEKRFEFDIIP